MLNEAFTLLTIGKVLSTNTKRFLKRFGPHCPIERHFGKEFALELHGVGRNSFHLKGILYYALRWRGRMGAHVSFAEDTLQAF